MSRNTTRIQSFTRVSELADKDVLIVGPASGDRAKGITKEDLEAQFQGDSPGAVNPTSKLMPINIDGVFVDSPLRIDTDLNILISSVPIQSPAAIVELSAAYLVLTSDDIILGKGTFIVTLPPSSSAFKSVSIKSVLGGGTITVLPDGSDFIEGLPAQELAQGEAMTIAPTTTGDWVII